MKTYWEEFNLMGTDIILSAFLKEDERFLLNKAKKMIYDFSNNFSRFLPNNELAALNNAEGKPFSASPTMIELLLEMQKFYRETKGIFDPTIINSLETIGYNKTFNPIGKLPRGKNKFNNEPEKKINPTFKKIREKHISRVKLEKMNIYSSTISAPKGFRIDTGGIGKGFIVDHIAEIILNKIKNYWISAGGDLLVNGSKENSPGWEIEVQNPSLPDQSIFSLKTNGEKIGIATSGIIKRKGEKNGLAWHHLIDPRNGLPAKNDILSVTAISSNTKRADVFAKTVLILGKKKGLDFIEKQPDSACIIFSHCKPPLFSQKASKYLT